MMQLKLPSPQLTGSAHAIEDEDFRMIVSDEGSFNKIRNLEEKVDHLTELVGRLCLQNVSMLKRMVDMEKMVETCKSFHNSTDARVFRSNDDELSYPCVNQRKSPGAYS